MSSQSSSSAGKPADYVYFERTTAGFSEDALPRSKAAQLKLEHYYKVAVEAAIERNQRCVFGGVDLSSLEDSSRWLLTTMLCFQACGGRTKTCG